VFGKVHSRQLISELLSFEQMHDDIQRHRLVARFTKFCHEIDSACAATSCPIHLDRAAAA